MIFSFYIVTKLDHNSTNYELDIDNIVCSFDGESILMLIKKLEDYYENMPENISWDKNISAIEYFQSAVDNNEVTITNLYNVTYETIEDFIANIIPDLHNNYPELFV